MKLLLSNRIVSFDCCVDIQIYYRGWSKNDGTKWKCAFKNYLVLFNPCYLRAIRYVIAETDYTWIMYSLMMHRDASIEFRNNRKSGIYKKHAFHDYFSFFSLFPSSSLEEEWNDCLKITSAVLRAYEDLSIFFDHPTKPSST